jgi:hypothetical protein
MLISKLLKKLQKNSRTLIDSHEPALRLEERTLGNSQL